MKTILKVLGYTLVIGVVGTLCVCIFLLGLDCYLKGDYNDGAYLYEGETWIDEVILVKYMATYGDRSFDVVEVAPNTALVRHRIITYDDLPGFERRVLSGKDFIEVGALHTAGIIGMVVSVILLGSFLFNIRPWVKNNSRR